jgi:hypothetical protein
MVLVLGVLFFVAGLLMLYRPSLLLFPDRVEIKNLLGNTLITYRFNSFKELIIDNNKLYLKTDGKKERIKWAHRYVMNPKDWKALKKISS